MNSWCCFFLPCRAFCCDLCWLCIARRIVGTTHELDQNSFTSHAQKTSCDFQELAIKHAGSWLIAHLLANTSIHWDCNGRFMYFCTVLRDFFTNTIKLLQLSRIGPLGMWAALPNFQTFNSQLASYFIYILNYVLKNKGKIFNLKCLCIKNVSYHF